MSNRNRSQEEQVEERELTDAEIEAIADRVFDRVYTEIGKNAVRALLWLVGAGVTAVLAGAAAWFNSTGKLPPLK